MVALDYGRSWIGSKGPENTVRFWVESRTRIIDERNGRFEDYCQCGACKSENTFAGKDLFTSDNYDFIPVFGPVHSVVFRRKAYLNEDYFKVYESKDRWGGQIYRLQEGKDVRKLVSNDDIRNATHGWLPLVSQTEIWNEETGLRAIIECPVKTMNINAERHEYQVDTGSVVLPDLSRRHERLADSLRLAFIAFNVEGFADFVIEAPTPIMKDGHEICKIHHYSNIISLPARNTLFALPE